MEIINFLRYILKSRILILAFLIYILFNISSFKTHWFDYFFSGSSIHYCCQGLDFYGIPNGVYSFFHGGDLSGNNLPENIKPYSDIRSSNPNDYHPITAFSIGVFLILFSPEKSFFIWMGVKIAITLITVYFIYRNFHNHKYLNFSLFIFLTNFSQYNEMRISQYQFLFNISLIYFLTSLVKNKNEFENGALYFLSLISKPISLLFFPILLIKKKYKTALTGIIVFLFSTITFYLIGSGKHFVENLSYHLFNPRIPDSIDFMSLDALIRSLFPASGDLIKIFKYLFLAGIYILTFKRKIHIFVPLFLLIVYFLFFYDNLFQYHFSVLGPILTMCILIVPEFQSKISRFIIFLINLPTVFFILRFFNFQFIFDPVYGPNPTKIGWQIVSFFQLLPIIILSLIILKDHFLSFKNEEKT